MRGVYVIINAGVVKCEVDDFMRKRADIKKQNNIDVKIGPPRKLLTVYYY